MYLQHVLQPNIYFTKIESENIYFKNNPSSPTPSQDSRRTIMSKTLPRSHITDGSLMRGSCISSAVERRSPESGMQKAASLELLNGCCRLVDYVPCCTACNIHNNSLIRELLCMLHELPRDSKVLLLITTFPVLLPHL